MSFDYNKVKNKSDDSHGSSWTAYSDLFMMLSMLFLLLYVSVNLRTQAGGVQAFQKAKQLQLENEDLKQQIQVYDTLRDNHLKTEGTQQENEVYQKLMSKLDLLKDEAKSEKEKLNQAAKDNEEKEYALNEYQKIIRNIINTNVLSKTQIRKSDFIIDKKETQNKEQQNTIAGQEQEMVALNKTFAQKEAEAASSLAAAQQEVETRGNQLAESKAQADDMAAKHQLQVYLLKSEYAEKEAKLKKETEDALASANATSAQKAERMAQFTEEAKARAAALATQLDALGAQVKTAENKANQAEKEKGQALADVQDLQKNNKNLSADLARAQAIANEKKELAGKIKGELNKAGLKGDVDEKSGDVTLSFGEEYFDTGSAELKPSMRETLKKFMPGYSRSLFSNKGISKNIENVEIIGFASSTFKGRYVPPDSLKLEDREAINYNLKLSFNRANSIFKHIFYVNKMRFEHQNDLLPRIKVVGRGYLPDGKTSSDIPKGIDEKTFCQQFNCKQAQKVIIKFKLKE